MEKRELRISQEDPSLKVEPYQLPGASGALPGTSPSLKTQAFSAAVKIKLRCESRAANLIPRHQCYLRVSR